MHAKNLDALQVCPLMPDIIFSFRMTRTVRVHAFHLPILVEPIYKHNLFHRLSSTK